MTLLGSLKSRGKKEEEEGGVQKCVSLSPLDVVACGVYLQRDEGEPKI